MQSRRVTPARRAVLVAISGIDASGKGYVADRLGAELEKCGLRTAVIHADGWLNLPHVRFSTTKPAEHFYEHAFRFDELIFPLRDRRKVGVEADYTEETATTYRRHRYQFEDVDVILLEAMFLLCWEYRNHYDLSIWVDCTYETALERALERALKRRQEGLSAADTIHSYRTLYFPAQEIHRCRDLPAAAACLRLINDPRLVAAAAA